MYITNKIFLPTFTSAFPAIVSRVPLTDLKTTSQIIITSSCHTTWNTSNQQQIHTMSHIPTFFEKSILSNGKDLIICYIMYNSLRRIEIYLLQTRWWWPGKSAVGLFGTKYDFLRSASLSISNNNSILSRVIYYCRTHWKVHSRWSISCLCTAQCLLASSHSAWVVVWIAKGVTERKLHVCELHSVTPCFPIAHNLRHCIVGDLYYPSAQQNVS